MKIVIIGAGSVGYELTRMISRREHVGEAHARGLLLGDPDHVETRR